MTWSYHANCFIHYGSTFLAAEYENGEEKSIQLEIYCMIGNIEENQALVFRYLDEKKSALIFNTVTPKFAASRKFHDTTIKDNLCSMIDRGRNFMSIRRAGQDIVTVIGHNRENIAALAEQQKLTKQARILWKDVIF